APPRMNGTCASQTTILIGGPLCTPPGSRRYARASTLAPLVRAWPRRVQTLSRGVAEIDGVAVLDHVVLAFEPELTAIAARGERSALDQRVPGHHFRADETALDVGVNRAGGFLRAC